MEKHLQAVDVWYEQIWVGDVHEDIQDDGPLFGAVMGRAIGHPLAGGSRVTHFRHSVVARGNPRPN